MTQRSKGDENPWVQRGPLGEQATPRGIERQRTSGRTFG
jgi:hypothetical protein